MMRASVSLLCALALGACLRFEPALPTYRDASVPLAVTSRGDIATLYGTWQVRGAMPSRGQFETFDFAPEIGERISVSFTQRLCDEGNLCETSSSTWPAERIAQNRLRILSDSRGGDEELWVLWTDEAARTAVIGSPDGRYGFILDREASGGEDRIGAARKILDFNGYDTSALRLRETGKTVQ